MRIYEISDSYGSEWYRAESAQQAREMFMSEHGLSEDEMASAVLEVEDPSRLYVTIEVTADTLMEGPAERIATTWDRQQQLSQLTMQSRIRSFFLDSPLGFVLVVAGLVVVLAQLPA